jgi:hypothetical protein
MSENILSNRELAELVVTSMDKRDFTLYEKHVAEDAVFGRKRVVHTPHFSAESSGMYLK